MVGLYNNISLDAQSCGPHEHLPRRFGITLDNRKRVELPLPRVNRRPLVGGWDHEMIPYNRRHNFHTHDNIGLFHHKSHRKINWLALECNNLIDVRPDLFVDIDNLVPTEIRGTRE